MSIDDKKSKSKATDQKVNISISLPGNINKILDKVSKASPVSAGNKSAFIVDILVNFFENREYVKESLNLDPDSVLVPVHLYLEVAEISRVGLKGKIGKKEIETVRLGSGEYVVIDKESYKNTYVKLAKFIRMLGDTNINLMELSEEVIELENKITKYDKILTTEVLEKISKL